MTRLKHGAYLLIEKVLTWCVHPYLRARLLRLLGAQIGRNVRVYEARFFNLSDGFAHLKVADDAHVGTGCLIDLTDDVCIGRGAVLSPGVTVLTHSDPGEHHDAPLAQVFPRTQAPTVIGDESWIGTGAVLLSGAVVGQGAVVGANSLVNGEVDAATVVVGSPARPIRRLERAQFDADGLP